MIILDTNVLSALMRARPDAAVVSWLDRQAAESIWITSITAFETRFGLALLPAGRRRRFLEEAFARLLEDDLENHVLDFDLDMAPARHMAFFVYEDRPGVIGKVGTILGQAGVNIASMEVGRKQAGGLALMGLTVDSPIPPGVLQEIEQAVGTEAARSMVLPG